MLTMTTEQTPKGLPEVLGWIEKILDDRSWTATELARKSNLAPSTILRMMNDPDHRFTPSLTTLKKIATGARVAIPESLVQAFDIDKLAPSNRTSSPGFKAGGMDAPREAPAAVSSVPFVRVSSLPESLQPKALVDIKVRRLPSMEGDSTAFALRMPSDELGPAVPSGTMLHATKLRDPVTGDIVMATRQDGRTLVRLLKEMNESGVTLAFFKDAEMAEEVIAFEDIRDLAIVVGIVRS